MSTELDHLRDEINKIDKQIVELLEKRLEFVVDIGKVKKQKGKNVFYPDREKFILNRILEYRKKFPKESLSRIFSYIFQVSRSFEENIKVAFLGPEGTYSHEAATQIFGPDCEYIPKKTISDIFEAVSSNFVHYSVVPIENTTEGVVTYTIDMFNTYPMKIISELYLKIVNNLLSKETSLNKIKKVYSHRQPLSQSRKWLETHLPNAKIIETNSTAEAALLVSKQKHSAAIGSEEAARIYGLNILRASTQTSHNYTRFFVIGKENDNNITGKDKTSILFTAKDEPGALYSIISYFVEANINLSKIESRPYPGRPWEYFFFVDIDGHVKSDAVKKTLEKIKQKTIDLNILGSYPNNRQDNYD